MSNTDNKLLQDISKMYPYGEFPSQYTKKQKNTDINNPNILNYVRENTETNPPQPTQQQTSKTNNLDLNSLLPLITTLSNGKKMDSTSILSTILPLIAGNKSKDINSILKLLNTKSNKHDTSFETYHNQEIPPSAYKDITSYERV